MRRPFAVLLALSLAACAMQPPGSPDALKQQVADAERAFARTMAQRDHAAFTAFLADETVFFAGDKPLRGKAAVAAAWQPFYEKPAAPFSWEPATVEVLDSGTLALSSGPVRDPAGKQVGTFTSIWRQDAPASGASSSTRAATAAPRAEGPPPASAPASACGEASTTFRMHGTTGRAHEPRP